MTVRFIKSWNGYYEGQIVTSPNGGNSEATLVSLGYAVYDLDGPGNNAALSRQSKGIAVSGNKTLAASDLEQVQDVSAAATLTIPTDAILGIAADDRVVVSAYQMNAGAVAWAGSGATLRGTAPTAAQYLVTGLVHVGLNEWAYL
jgi:hypothetical protein